jgi:hypothetical protein
VEKGLGGKMQTLLEKFVSEGHWNQSYLTAKWLAAGFPINGEAYGINVHAKKRLPKEDKGFKISQSGADQFGDLFIEFAYGKYKIGAFLHLWTNATCYMIMWLEAIVLGRSLGVSFDEEGDFLHLYAEKIDDKFTNFIFFVGMDWIVKKENGEYKFLGKEFKNKVFHIKIETRKLVNMFYKTVLEYAKEIDPMQCHIEIEGHSNPANVCNSEIVNNFLDLATTTAD